MIVHKKLANGFAFIEIKNSAAEAKIALQGAHLFHYERVGEEPILWLSEVSDFEYGKAIRGGVPVCWPWFGFNEDKTLPQHGFARTAIWECVSCSETDENSSSVILRLTHSQESLKMWPYLFELDLHVTISDKLTMELKTTNLDSTPFTITQALHTYFALTHISDAVIKGLDKKPYLNALTWKNEVQEGDIIFNQEVDRVYQEVDGEITLCDKNRTLHVRNENSSSVVVWNPWIEKTKRMNAMKPNAYEHMLCIESANAFDDARVINPQKSHTLKAVIY
ncbi:MAG: D-hexose-6-phosphate mutarotase [Sulfurimonas sp.]|jgi:glucose-6-phosphate 1-epimerase